MEKANNQNKKLSKLHNNDFKSTLIKDLGMKLVNKRNRRFAEFSCVSCGKAYETRVDIEKCKKFGTCSTCSKKGINTTHGKSNTKIFNVFMGMKQRCYNKNSSSFEYYGKKGIRLCDEWVNNFEEFYKWAISNGYNENLSIDRIDGNKDYCPENCRWVASNIQARNKSIKNRNNTTGFKGVTKRSDRNLFIVGITVDNKKIYIGSNKCRLASAYMYDEYVRKNNLEHTTNF